MGTRRMIVPLLALLGAGLLLWLLLRAPPPASSATEPADDGFAAAAAPREVVDAAEAPGTAEPRRTAVAAAPAATEPPPVDRARTASDTPASRSERREIDLIVQDRHGAPVEDAEIVLTGLRTKRERGSHYLLTGETSLGRTRADGTAKLWFPVWTTRDDETGELTFEVSHPAFVTRVVDEYEIDGPPRVVVLDPGAMVIVSGWIGSRSDVVLDVEPHLSLGTDVSRADWLPIRDGRLSTVKLAPGRHAVWLSHESAARGRLFSAIEAFDLAEAEPKELHLELVPGLTVEGRLEDEVPRPVSGGEVLLNLQHGSTWEGGPRMLRDHRAPVRADGTFTLTDLPPGDGQVIALCDGWSSEGIATRDPALLGLRREGIAGEALEALIDRVIATRGERGRIAQPVAPGTTKELVVLMEPTATLRVTLRGPDGGPVVGAKVSCWPNVLWLAGSSQVFLNREYAAESGADGVATVANLPPCDAWFGVEHPSLDLPHAPGEGDRSRQAELRSGETLEVELALEAK